ncbi:alpha/beta fold hydrolase [Acanthopleuribacter pedis]|uniref:Alpha/beta hydrolase n=1 Tax=Acanthopleuribacter pedis TaxID=442870 RepID=A0A8J7Q618_9BACT|nr:alpha/beta hydrolase [Acanthopleuribacter pedis]MBO1317299.1 alpha/beta hydrolase [Acanthopleuribacter pedis]MBO1318606.1 alpha/beta hydrolase [Acanthopleuribacter pedis]
MLTSPLPVRRSPHFDLHIDRIGRGEPVLVIPGFGCGNWLFKPIARQLQPRYSFLLPDLPGMGASPDAGCDYSFEQLADHCHFLMQRLGHPRYHLIGISMGGFIAQKLLLQHGEAVASCVLLATTAAHETIEAIPLLDETQLHAMYQMEPAAMVRANSEATVHPGFAQRDPAAYQLLLDQRLRHVAPLRSLLRQRRAVARYFESPVPLHLINNPVLLLTGDADRLVPTQHATQLADQLPNASVTRFAESDHWFFWERHHETAAAIATFLAGDKATESQAE